MPSIQEARVRSSKLWKNSLWGRSISSCVWCPASQVNVSREKEGSIAWNAEMLGKMRAEKGWEVMIWFGNMEGISDLDKSSFSGLVRYKLH